MDLQVSGVSRDFAHRVVPEKVYGLGWSRVDCNGLYIGRMEDKTGTTFMGYVGIMEKNMETTIMGYIISVIAGRQLEATQHANKWKPLAPRQTMWCWSIGYRAVQQKNCYIISHRPCVCKRVYGLLRKSGVRELNTQNKPVVDGRNYGLLSWGFILVVHPTTKPLKPHWACLS